jgi:hypothetical protein
LCDDAVKTPAALRSGRIRNGGAFFIFPAKTRNLFRPFISHRIIFHPNRHFPGLPMALFPPPPLPPVPHHAADSVHIGPTDPGDMLRCTQWGRRIFRAPDLALPMPAQFASEVPFTVQFRGTMPERKGTA